MKNNAFFKEENVFMKNNFIAPPHTFAPVYGWVWNGPMTREETDRQLDEMQRLGIRAIVIIPEPKSFRPGVIPTAMEPDYLTPAYFEEYKYVAEGAKKRQMLMWLYDEGGWPSGGACGKVMFKHPEFTQQRLGAREVEFAKGDVYAAADETASAFLPDGTVIEKGYTFESDVTVKEYFSNGSCYFDHRYAEVPDLTKRAATDAFIEETHEGYKPYLKNYFGDVIKLVFTDEAKAPRRFPFRKEIEEEFERRNGYSIRPLLPELYGTVPPSEQGVEARIAWYDLCADLFRDNYLLVEKEWSNKHSMAFAGHLDLDHKAPATCNDSGVFHIMRALRSFDVPGVDVIWRQIFPYFNECCPEKLLDGEINGFYPRYASSAATQTGSRYALSESFGVFGAGLTFDQMRYVMNYQAVRGINMYHLFGIPYHREGFLMTGEMPYFTEKHACYADLSSFNKYAERITYLVSLGDPVASTALYMPVRDFWAGVAPKTAARKFELAGHELEDARVLFDVVDDDIFALADTKMLENGIISVGRASYTSVVVPECRYMAEGTVRALNKFIAGGGQVFVVSDTAIPGLEGTVLAENAKNIICAPIEIVGDASLVRLAVRQAENGRLYMLFNEATENREFDVKLGDTYILDAENGRVVKPQMHGDGFTVTLSSGQAAFLWQGEAEGFENEAVYGGEVTLDGEYTFRKSSRFVIGEMSYELVKIDEPEATVALGDWTATVGRGFSGSGVYKTEFVSPKKEGRLCLDLGEVRYSCEVFLNEDSLGVCTMSPYRYEIDAEKLKDKNTLEIRVSNTAANEYNTTKSFDKWQPWQLTPYHPKELVFHEDSMSGGLIGPVKLKF